MRQCLQIHGLKPLGVLEKHRNVRILEPYHGLLHNEVTDPTFDKIVYLEFI